MLLYFNNDLLLLRPTITCHLFSYGIILTRLDFETVMEKYLSFKIIN